MVSVCLVGTFESVAHAVGDNGNLGGGGSGGNAGSSFSWDEPQSGCGTSIYNNYKPLKIGIWEQSFHCLKYIVN